ncbi:MAG: alpha/beta hydrolase [Synergistaceae bacterium]|jgi:pimeloyl-ACP methyl ester carboxylesterase|nr:alpha/beta hydrolase [Synergistaceae bacterium]
MATFAFGKRRVYYEDMGKGEPLLVLNGIFMSCASWEAFVPSFAAKNRLILVDFLDQGKSGKMDGEYSLSTQADMVLALLEEIKLESVNLMGVSYGGEVAMKAAARCPDKVKKLILSNTAAYTSKWLRDIGRSWDDACRSHDGRQFFKTCIPIVYSPRFYEKHYTWVAAREDLFVTHFTPEVYDAFGRLIRSAETHDERGNLSAIASPTLVISSEYDFVTPPYQQKELAEAIPNASHVTVQNAGHAVMYEKPAEFVSLVLGFVGSDLDIRVVS